MYRYFSYWGVGVGVLILLVASLVLIISFVTSYLLSHRTQVLTGLRRVLWWLIGTRLWRAVDGRARKRFPRVYRMLRKTIDLTTAPGISLAVGISLSIVFLLLFLGTAFDVVFGIDVARADVRFMYLIRTMISDTATVWFVFVTRLANAATILTLFALIALYLLLLRQYRWIAYLALATSSGYVLFTSMKWLFLRPRPSDLNLIALPFDPSFPSGHALLSVCFYGFLAFLIIRKLRSIPLKTLVAAVTSLLIIVIGLSRVYLGVHYPSDVFGGWYLGLGALSLVITFFEVERVFHFPGLTAVKDLKYSKKFQTYYLTLLVVSIVVFLLWSRPLMNEYTQSRQVQTVSAIVDFIPQAHTHSENLVGRPMSPISFIVIADRGRLISAFQAAGWHLADLPNVRNFFKLYSNIAKDTQYPAGPLTPAFYNSRTNDMGFEKETVEATSRQRHHTRFWDSGFRLQGVTIWVATASFDEGIGIGPEIKFPTHKIDPHIDIEREFIFSDLQATGLISESHKVPIVPPEQGTNAAGDPFTTDGWAYSITLVP
ncbi:MAG: LssY C-terminal domain-containing protein [Candidatus Komeilibacteria bacterium]|nr:LssY C-terminal domain-containing protein [Candidatus Komeilibacteria bacterium]